MCILARFCLTRCAILKPVWGIYYLCLMKILTYNVNGIRSAASKGLFDFLKDENPDVVCLQEIKAMQDQADIAAIEALG